MGDDGGFDGVCVSARARVWVSVTFFGMVAMVCNNQDIEVDRGRTKGQEKAERRNFPFIPTIYVVYDKVI